MILIFHVLLLNSIGKKYDPSVSETYKALQEEQIGDHVQEVTVPVQQKIFSPNKVIPGKVKTLLIKQQSCYAS